MKIIDIAQGSTPWHAWRKQGITSTDAAVLLGRSKYKSVWRIWAEKLGKLPEEDLSQNFHVQRGIRDEDKARQVFEHKHDDLILPVCAQSEDVPIMRASLDGLSNNGEPVELKCPGEAVWKQVCTQGENAKAYQLYEPQLQHQILVTGADRGFLAFYFQGELREFEVPRNESLIQDLISKSISFWEHIEKQREPEKDPILDFYIPQDEEIPQWMDAATKYQKLYSAIQLRKKRLALLEKYKEAQADALEKLMDKYRHAEYGGVKVTRFERKGAVNYKALVEANMPNLSETEIKKYEGKSSQGRLITLMKNTMPVEEAL